MQTIIDNLKNLSDEIHQLLQELLLKHSSIYLWNKHHHHSAVVVISLAGNYAFKELDDNGRKLQAHLLEKYNHFYDLTNVLLREQPKDTLRELVQANTTILNIIEQSHTCCKNTNEALEEADNALQTHLKLLCRLFDHSLGEVVLVPDTNALIYNPKLESWEFSNFSKFTIILLPTVLSELDGLKINHRNEEVRKKAETLIRQMKEYRRRGKLTVGVTLVNDKSKIQAVSIEPDMTKSLQWLDSNNNDDRLIAGVIEVMRNRPNSYVMAVSRDINFQNKAEFADLPFIEPPELKIENQ